MTTHPTPVPQINALLSELVTSVQAILDENLLGIYLQGSFAVGGWDADSDVDFIIAIRDEVSETGLAALQEMHSRIYDRPSAWATHLEGSYFPAQTLRGSDSSKVPLLFLDNTSRSLIWSNHCNTLVVRWCVRECGITLVGPDPRELIGPIPPADLQREVLTTMRDWAEELFAHREQVNTRWFQAYAVLTYCRMLHTLHTGRIDSKLAGSRWAQGALDARWADLIERAWQQRPNPSEKVRTPADHADLAKTFAFIQYCLELNPKDGPVRTDEFSRPEPEPR